MLLLLSVSANQWQLHERHGKANQVSVCRGRPWVVSFVVYVRVRILQKDGGVQCAFQVQLLCFAACWLGNLTHWRVRCSGQTGHLTPQLLHAVEAVCAHPATALSVLMRQQCWLLGVS